MRDDDGSDDYTLTSDAAGNLTDDGESYEYVYHAWSRLRKVKNQSAELVSEHWHNGLGYRIAFQHDADGTNGIESDERYHLVYDTSWRIVASLRDGDVFGINNDNAYKEQFVYHNVRSWGPALTGPRAQSKRRGWDSNPR